MKVVWRDVPDHFTVDPVTKPVPFTVNVNEGPPALAVVGCAEVRTGACAYATAEKQMMARESRILYIVIRVRRFS
jgi:hypothetical protein